MFILSNLQSIARFTGNTSFVPAPCNVGLSLGAAALLGGSSLLGSTLGGIFGSSSQSKANKLNYKIWQEQKEFNRQEAQKQRDWQELMQQLYGTSSAKASNLRSAGLNPLLGDVSASSVGSGATAVSPQAPTMNPVNPTSGVKGIEARGRNCSNNLSDVVASILIESIRRSKDTSECKDTS